MAADGDRWLQAGTGRSSLGCVATRKDICQVQVEEGGKWTQVETSGRRQGQVVGDGTAGIMVVLLPVGRDRWSQVRTGVSWIELVAADMDNWPMMGTYGSR